MGRITLKCRIFGLLKVLAEDINPVAHARVVAAIVYKGRIVSIGHCSYKTHPFQKKYGKNGKSVHLHAEIDAIIKAKKRGVPLDRSSLYVLRIKRPYAFSTSFILGLAKPCEGCQKAIEMSNIRNVYYSLDNELI